MILFDVTQSVLSLILMIAIGYWLAKINWFDEAASSLLVKLALNITIPFMILHNMVNYFDPIEIVDLGIGLISLFLAILTNYFLSIIIALLFSIPKNQIGIFTNMFTLSNTMFIGLPVSMALFGEKSIPYALTYYIVNIIIFWTIGVFLVQKDRDPSAKFSGEVIKKIFTPALVSLLLSAIVITLQINIPNFLIDVAKMVGGMTTPIALFYIGIVFYHLFQEKNIIINKQIILVLLGRFIISPLVVFLFLNSLNLPILMKKVFFIQSAMPVMTQLVIVAKAYNADEEFAALGAFISTIVGFMLIPIYAILLKI